MLFSRWYLEARRGLWWNRKYLQLKCGNKLSKKLFVFCEFISQSYRFPLKKPFTKTALVEFSKWYLEAHRRLWWKRKYPKIKTEKKLSEKLLCVLLIHLREYSFPLKKPLAKPVLVEFAMWYFEDHRELIWKRKYSKKKTEKKVSEKLLCVLLIHLTDLPVSPQEPFR